ncbi:MAG: hypothetical protein CVU43_10370 [Chloroflexi bacterium HGW-Chloroflexi-5]|jgi:hypothetical protein|nr:MAG: hypothetical protein CVU43_10370 [Chloroflexi bacterium HGW-Chloroflexi-5]
MPKYNQYSSYSKPIKEKPKIHPVWRGIGCLMIIVIPVFSYFTANFLINTRYAFSWVLIPQDLIFTQLKDPLLWVKIFYAVIIALLLFLIMGIITFVIDKFFGPRKRGPYDVK